MNVLQHSPVVEPISYTKMVNMSTLTLTRHVINTMCPPVTRSSLPLCFLVARRPVGLHILTIYSDGNTHFGKFHARV